ncbi:MAG: hydantoinase/oxoprolinase family protein [Anaerolineae bacterium]|nr:hydantoinase/oxoprolinase family protein [Anaerolineae bacterium]
MTIALGIDTGGTYTDAALVDYESGEVQASAKALTTHHDLAVGIGTAIAAVLETRAVDPADVGLAALSTTLATNALVEGKGSPVCLLLLGYDAALIEQFGFAAELVTPNVVYLPGGHDTAGNEQAPLDERATREAIRAWQGQVEAFAVSGYFGVRNPAHELRVRDLVRELTGLPVTCGHELTSRLDSVRRATTTALNASLIPLLTGLIQTVRRTLGAHGIAAPLMVVKGDGSLVRDTWIMQRPVETILSGPAASVVGAARLAGDGRGDVWVVDVGGTTTDIAALHGGRPWLNPEGAQVGRWRTMVEAIDVHTAGLGGDSHVRLDREGRLQIGPQRVVPLCLLAQTFPDVIALLRPEPVALPRPTGAKERWLQRKAAHRASTQSGLAGQFVTVRRAPTTALAEGDRALLEELAAGPVALDDLAGRGHSMIVLGRLEALERQGLVQRAGFTPTDALHALGRLDIWNAEAARRGAELMAKRAGLPAEAFCEQVVAGVSDRVATELVSKVLGDEMRALPDWDGEPTAAALLTRALRGVDGLGLGCDLTLRRPIIAIGAPVGAYMPATAGRLHTALILPPHAEVANAVGAVAGSVIQRVRAHITPLEGHQQFRLQLPDGAVVLNGIEAAVAHARTVMPPQVEALARAAGAGGAITVQMERRDLTAPVAEGWGDALYIGTELVFTAVGRPSPAQ